MQKEKGMVLEAFRALPVGLAVELALKLAVGEAEASFDVF